MKNWLIKRFVLIAHRAHSQSGLSLPTLQFDSHAPDESLKALMLQICSALTEITEEKTRERIFYEGMEAAMIQFFGGRLSVAILAKYMQYSPRLGARLMNQFTPLGFEWLVGRILKNDRYSSHIPLCKFRKILGDQACVDLCQKPTEYFFQHRIKLPLTLTPSTHDTSCSIRYGTS